MAVESHDKKLSELLTWVGQGKAQLPEFQRSWVWDDTKICKLIESITSGYPMGAAMFLESGGESVRFKCRKFTGVRCPDEITPDWLVLDGQQRLTTLYQVFMCKKPVETRLDTNKDKTIFRYYYLDIEKCLDPEADRLDAIISISEKKQILSDIGRTIELDLSTPDREYEHLMFPLNLVFSPNDIDDWRYAMEDHFANDNKYRLMFRDFSQKILRPIQEYQMPVIQLTKETPKEAVCQIFENVNTGGVSLTVFELVTAIFAMDDFELRKDWDNRKEKFLNGELLSIITATDFLTACTLLSSYEKGGTVSCKKKDVLNLTLEEYKVYSNKLTQGFIEAEKMLEEERIFSSKDLPYTTQFIPLAVLCTLLDNGNQIKEANIKKKIKQWYWCGVFGEMYGGANETRYVYDVVDVMDWIHDDSKLPRTVRESYFNPTRLLSLQSRQSAAYKGIMALVLKNHCKDFISGREMDFVIYKSEYIDIHHIFPKAYCESMNYEKRLWNSVVNKTPITYSTNREIGGEAPSIYLSKIEKKGKVSEASLNEYVCSHWIDANCCRNDDFYKHIVNRAKSLLDAIESATGKAISGRDSEEVLNAFGESV